MTTLIDRDIWYAVGYLQCYIDTWGDLSNLDAWFNLNASWDANITHNENGELVIKAYPVVNDSVDLNSPHIIWSGKADAS
jgi:hypothetical protein